MSVSEPAISVCIPTWNRAPLLGHAIQSVLDQERRDVEVVIVDDGSTDGTADVVSAFGDPRVRYHRSARRAGISRARNECLSLARGRYIAWLDSDDLYAHGALGTLAAVLDRHADVGLVHAAYDLVDGHGTPLKGWALPFDRDVLESGREALQELVLANYITTTTVLMRRELCQQAGRFAPEMGNNCEDWDLWLRCALETAFAYTTAVVTHVRLHEGNAHRKDVRLGRRLRAQIRAVERFFRLRRPRIPEAGTLERRARAALATRIVSHAGDSLTRGRRAAAAQTAGTLTRHAAGLAAPRAIDRLVAAAAHGEEFSFFTQSRALVARLAVELAGTRFVERLRKTVASDPAWAAASRHTARIVRRVTNASARIAVIDKWDPTILHLSRRRGCHFPDLRLLPEGYPHSSEQAIDHLEALRRRGVTYLALPCPSFWWLQHYAGFRDHLRASYSPAWDDEQCVVFALQRSRAGH